MIKFTDGHSEAEVNDMNWPLLADLLTRWGYGSVIESGHKIKTIKVRELSEKLCELSAWGIPWKRTKWDIE